MINVLVVNCSVGSNAWIMRSQWGVGLSIWRFIFLFALFLFRILVLLISIIIGFNGIHLFLTSCIVNNIFLSMLLSWIGWFIYIDRFFIFECLHWFTDFISDCMFFCSLCRFNADQFIQFFFVILSSNSLVSFIMLSPDTEAFALSCLSWILSIYF